MIKYIKLAESIRQKILDGEFPVDSQLPFEKDLCAQYDASKMTVKKALDILMAEGLIVKRRGAGTFVKGIAKTDMRNLIAASQFKGFTARYKEGGVTNKVIVYDAIPADKQIASKLGIKEFDFVYHIVRVRYVDNEPYVLETTYMPIMTIRGLHRDHLDGSLYQYIEKELKLKIQSGHRMIRVRKGSDTECQHLALEKDDPVAEVEQVAFLDTGEAFEFSKSVHTYKTFQFETVLLR